MNLKKLPRALHIITRLGFINGLKYIVLRSTRVKQYASIKVRSLCHSMKVRFNTTDVDVFDQIFLFDEYDIHYEIEPRFIIDAGANVGYAAIFFANKFREAKIIAIEPETNNFEVLVENTKAYHNIEVIQAGLWFEKTKLNIIDRNTGSYGFKVEPSVEQGNVDTITIAELLEKFEKSEIDILKIDIEGSEKYVFENEYNQWLPVVKLLIIEIHDYINPGASKSVLTSILKYNFHMSQKGEYLIFRRLE